jgi:hypothetical protein
MAAPSRSVGPRPIARKSRPRDGAASGVSADPGDGRSAESVERTQHPFDRRGF